MAVSSAFVVTPKLENLLSNQHNPTSSSSPEPLGVIGIRALPMNNKTRRGLIQRARCELSASKAASVSALEQLKTSAIDRTITAISSCDSNPNFGVFVVVVFVHFGVFVVVVVVHRDCI